MYPQAKRETEKLKNDLQCRLTQESQKSKARQDEVLRKLLEDAMAEKEIMYDVRVLPIAPCFINLLVGIQRRARCNV